MVQQPPSSLYFLDSPPFVLSGPAVRVRGKEAHQSPLYVLSRDIRDPGQPRNAGVHVPILVGHGKHGDPSQSGPGRFLPYGRSRNAGEQLRVGFAHGLQAAARNLRLMEPSKLKASGFSSYRSFR